MSERRFILSNPNHTAPVVDGSADLSGANGTMKVEHKNTQYAGQWDDETDAYTFTYELVSSNEAGTSTPIEIGESTNQYVTGYQASSDTWRGTSAEFIITALNPLFTNNDLTAQYNIVVTDPYYEEPPMGLGNVPPPPPPPPPPESDEDRTGDGSPDNGENGSAVEYTSDIRPLDDIIPSTPLTYNGDDSIITLDLRLITYKPSALAEILNPKFKSY